MTRTRPAGSGQILYNTTSTLTRNGGAVASSLGELYRTRALPPAYTWLDASVPPAPTVTTAGSLMTIAPGNGEAARWWVIRSQTTSGWTTRVVFGAERTVALPAGTSRAIVNAVDIAGNLSAEAEWRQ